MLPEPNVIVPVVFAMNPAPLTVRVESTVPLGADKVIAGAARTTPVGNASRSSDKTTMKPNAWDTFLNFVSSASHPVSSDTHQIKAHPLIISLVKHQHYPISDKNCNT